MDQALSRLTKAGTLRRVARGLYDLPRITPVVKRTVPPDPYSALKTIARKYGLRIFPSGMAAANCLGLTNAVQVTTVFGTDGRSRTIKIGNTSVSLKHAGREVLAWASRPAFNAVLALSWLGEAVVSRSPDIPGILREKLTQRQKRDLLKGVADLPAWMVPAVRKIARGPARVSQSDIAGITEALTQNRKDTYLLARARLQGEPVAME